ncbi:MAG: anaerobic ribonucleoside-triphosphate reductase activating protein [Bernardetiaceae bacterium]|nr:anaerobic ribonucleoside-triphosphate reductase activating protein [Bernardetiaceae bacterium]
MNITHVEEYSFIYGPGCRYIIWVQGCSIHCKGCWNKDMWSFETKEEISVEKLVDRILKEKDFIEGVTLLGGEPFDQYTELLSLVKTLYQHNLSVILYTGYEKEELKHKNYTEVLNYIDILISGRYVEKLRNMNLGLVGSSNQEITFYSDRYTSQSLSKTNQVEISITKTGKVLLYGYP